MLFKRYESSEDDHRTWLHVPSGTHWSTSSDIQINGTTAKSLLGLYLNALNEGLC